MSSPKVRAARVLDVALAAKGQLFPSYPDLRLKCLMRKDVLALISAFPSLSLSATTASSPAYPLLGPALPLLEASGVLCASPPLRLSVVLHPFHPAVPPLVVVTSAAPTPTPTCHPLLHPLTGAASTPYLHAWQHPKSNLPDLVHNLVKIFHFWPVNVPKPQRSLHEKRSSASRREALDRLSMLLLSDMAACDAARTEEVIALSSIKSALSARAAALSEAVRDLEEEKTALEAKVMEVKEAASALSEWLGDQRRILKVLDGDAYVEEAFEVVVVDEEANGELPALPIDNAIDEAMEAADEALRRKAVGLAEYLREMRAMAKEQFHHLKVASTAWP